MKEVLAGVTSEWLRKNLVVGREFHGEDLERLRAECLSCELPGSNVDDEPLAAAMLHLIEAARARTGRVFIQ